MGVRKAQEAPTATAIKKGSALTPIETAIPTEIGAIIRAVAALLIISERHIVNTIIITKIDQLGKLSVIFTINSAINWVLPVVCKALLTMQLSTDTT